MSEQSDRDILIEVRTDVKALVRDMVEPGGRVPKLEATVEEHGKQLERQTGERGPIVWTLGVLVTLIVGLICTFVAHVLAHPH